MFMPNVDLKVWRWIGILYRIPVSCRQWSTTWKLLKNIFCSFFLFLADVFVYQFVVNHTDFRTFTLIMLGFLRIWCVWDHTIHMKSRISHKLACLLVKISSIMNTISNSWNNRNEKDVSKEILIKFYWFDTTSISM